MHLRSLLFPAVLLSLAVPVVLATSPVAVFFSDVPSDAWFASYVQDAVRAGIVSGYKDASGNPTGRFGPESNVTIAEALKISIESAGYDRNLGQGYGHWAAKYLSIAIGEHFELTPNAKIDLDRPATRAEVASLVADAFKLPWTADTLIPENFTDVDDANPAHHYLAVNTLLEAEIIVGDNRTCTAHVDTVCPKTTFRPLSLINRAEVVKIAMLARAKSTSKHQQSFSSSRSARTCTIQECGPAPLMPNWQCSDGSIGGPSCERMTDGRCAWLVHQCSLSSDSSSSHWSSSHSSSLSSSRSSSSSSSIRNSIQAAVTVLYTANGFSPSVVRIKLGQTVLFKNTTDDDDLWVASNPHPVHTGYSGFDQGRSVLRDEEYAFLFKQRGTWGYHNHVNPHFTGQVIVE